MTLGLINGSVVKWVNALSGVAIAADGSSNPVDLRGFTGGLLVLNTGSAPSLNGMKAYVMRSATSDGTFQTFASVGGGNANNIHSLRAFAINSSAVWHRVFYQNGGGSFIGNIAIMAFNGRNQPVPSQESNVSLYSDVLV